MVFLPVEGGIHRVDIPLIHPVGSQLQRLADTINMKYVVLCAIFGALVLYLPFNLAAILCGADPADQLIDDGAFVIKG